jgi:hypothetical protein
MSAILGARFDPRLRQDGSVSRGIDRVALVNPRRSYRTTNSTDPFRTFSSVRSPLTSATYPPRNFETPTPN